LVWQLYEAKFERQDILDLFRLIDWLMPLPEALEIDFRRNLAQFERQKNMPFITSIERLGREEGRVEGRVEGRTEGVRQALLEVFPSRFGEVPPELQQRLEATSDPAQLQRWHRLAITIPSANALIEVIRGDEC